MGEQNQSYTYAIAHEPGRQKQRTTIQFCLLNLFPNSRLFHWIAGWISIAFGFFICAYCFTGFIALIPSLIFSKYIMGWPSFFNHKSANASTSAGSFTALVTLNARSQMNLMKCGGPDSIAPRFIHQTSLFGPAIPGSYWFTHMYIFLRRIHFYLTGRDFYDQVSERFFHTQFGPTALLQVRTCWVDDVVDVFATKNEKSPFNVVVLGAGYDSRCYRLQSCQQKNARLYEIDAPGTQASKKNLLKKAKVDCSDVHFVSCDFENENWMDVLVERSDFNKTLPTLFLWEGVTMYLDREVVLATIREVSKCGKGSCIAFDYFDKACFNEKITGQFSAIGEQWKFGMDFHDVDDLVKDCNKEGSKPMHIMDHLRPKEMKERYLARYGVGGHVGFLGEFGGFLMLGSEE